MDSDRLQGIGKQVSGSIKEAVGKVTGDSEVEADGAAEKATGKVQNTVGGTKDKVRDVVNE